MYEWVSLQLLGGVCAWCGAFSVFLQGVGGIARGGREFAGCGGKLLRQGEGLEWGGEEIVGVSGVCSGRGGILQCVCSTHVRVQMREFAGSGGVCRGWGSLQN